MSPRFPHLHLLVGQPLTDGETMTRLRSMDAICMGGRTTEENGRELLLTWPSAGCFVRCSRADKPDQLQRSSDNSGAGESDRMGTGADRKAAGRTGSSRVLASLPEGSEAPRPLGELADTGDRKWVWRIVAAGVYHPMDAEGTGRGVDDDHENEWAYPGPLPGNIPLRTVRKESLSRLGQHKLRPRRSGISHVTRSPWDRFDLRAGELKCSFGDGLPTRPGEQVRYSAALSNASPITLLLSYAPHGGGLSRATFMDPVEVARLDAVAKQCGHTCEPVCKRETCAKWLLYSDERTLEEARQREDDLGDLFGAGTRRRVDHRYEAECINVDVCAYGASDTRQHWVLATSGVSARSVPTSVLLAASQNVESGQLQRTGSSSSLLSAAGAARSQSSASASAGPAQRRGSSVGQGNALPASADPNPQPRCELIMYCDEPRDVYFEWVRHVAGVATGAGDPNSRVYHGLVVRCPRGSQQVTLAMGQPIESLLVINASSGPEAKAHDNVRAGEGIGEPVKIMVIVPLTALERSRAGEIVEKLGKTSTPVVFRENRPAYVV